MHIWLQWRAMASFMVILGVAFYGSSSPTVEAITTVSLAAFIGMIFFCITPVALGSHGVSGYGVSLHCAMMSFAAFFGLGIYVTAEGSWVGITLGLIMSVAVGTILAVSSGTRDEVGPYLFRQILFCAFPIAWLPSLPQSPVPVTLALCVSALVAKSIERDRKMKAIFRPRRLRLATNVDQETWSA